MKCSRRFFLQGLTAAAVCGRLCAADDQWLDIPYVEQVRAGCGSAAIAMVVQYWARQQPGLESALQESERINELLPPTSPKGIKGKELKRFLEEHGFRAFIFDGEIQDLQNNFQKGRPLIVCLALNGARGPLHYAVIAGLNDQVVWMNDPARGKLIREDMDRFLSAWKATANWTLLAVPQQAH
jgi:predicted double-glycine peptidase